MTQQPNAQPSEQEPLADKIIERIEQEGVVPKPRWQFSVANKFFWVVWALFLVIAAAASAAMIFAVANAGWEFHSVTHDNILLYLLDVLPMFWIVAIIVSLVLAYENLKRTKLGYRYPVHLMVAVGLIGVALGGVALFASGLGENVEENVGRHIPMYRSAVDSQRRFWMNPSRGLLGGEITQADPQFMTFTVRAFDGGMWAVDGKDLATRDREYLADHRMVRMVGVPGERSPFHACRVFPWEVRGHFSGGPPPSLGALPFETLSPACKKILR